MNPGEYAYVELNSIMYSNVKILAEWKREFGNKKHAYHNKNLRFYEKFTKQMLDSIENVSNSFFSNNIITEKQISKQYFHAGTVE